MRDVGVQLFFIRCSHLRNFNKRLISLEQKVFEQYISVVAVLHFVNNKTNFFLNKHTFHFI